LLLPAGYDKWSRADVALRLVPEVPLPGRFVPHVQFTLSCGSHVECQLDPVDVGLGDLFMPPPLPQGLASRKAEVGSYLVIQMGSPTNVIILL
jgi:hypothetical protein